MGTENKKPKIKTARIMSELTQNVKSVKNEVTRLDNAKLGVVDVIDNLITPDTSAPLSAQQGMQLNNRITAVAQIAQSGIVRGTFQTKAEMISALPTANVHDFAYVQVDETRNGTTWKYVWTETKEWMPLIQINNTPLDLLAQVYPVGSIYMSMNDVSPQQFLGGTWIRFGGGRVPMGVGNNGTTNYPVARNIGGAERHTLTINEMPSHNHVGRVTTAAGTAGGSGNERGRDPHNMGMTGGNQPHNNMQPWITVFMFERIA